MRVLIVSDIHANLAAFEAVLSDSTGTWDYVWCLGDVVGYGPDPNACPKCGVMHAPGAGFCQNCGASLQ